MVMAMVMVISVKSYRSMVENLEISSIIGQLSILKKWSKLLSSKGDSVTGLVNLWVSKLVVSIIEWVEGL